MKRERPTPQNSPIKLMETHNNAARWLNGIPAVVKYTGCSRRAVQNWVSSGRLPVKRLSARQLLILPEDVDQLITDMDREYRRRAGQGEAIFL